MVPFEYRRLREEEFAEAVRLDSIAFAEQHAEADVPFLQKAFDFERSLCAFDDGRLVGVSSALPLQLTLPGGRSLPTAGITWIAVLPTHRRRGILTQLMRGQLQQAVARGEAAAALVAAEGGIYGRFGMGPAVSVNSIHVDRNRAAFLRPVKTGGRLVLLTDEEAAAKLPPLYERLRSRRPGEVSRSAAWWDVCLRDPEPEQAGAGPMLHVMHESAAGSPDGYATYRVKEEWTGWVPANEVRLLELISADPDVYAALWQYLLSIDLSRGVSFENGRPDEPLRWLLADPRALQVQALIDFLWLRVLDLPGALGTRVYGTTGELTIEVVDGFPQHKTTTVLLRVSDPSAPTCQLTDRQPDLRLDLSALSAASLGGASFTALAGAGRARELRPGSLGRADAMFVTQPAPYCTTMF